MTPTTLCSQQVRADPVPFGDPSLIFHQQSAHYRRGGERELGSIAKSKPRPSSPVGYARTFT
jgi:hypothetical protein